MRNEGISLSRPIVATKAKKFFELLGLEGTFNSSSGWLRKFKQRRRIKEIDLHDQKLSGDEQTAKNFKTHFEQLLQSKRIVHC